MAECIFCKIAKGEVPSEKFYEDKDFFAFLDIHPKSKGHAILTPKVHFENIFDAKENELLKLGEALKKVSNILKQKYGCDGVNLINNSGKVAGQEINHFHFHIIPRYFGGSEVLESSENKTMNEEAPLRKVNEVSENSSKKKWK